MAQTAAHLVDHVIPPVSVRHWVISLPKRLRGFLGDRPKAVAAVTRIFMDEIENLLGAQQATPPSPRPGANGLVELSPFAGRMPVRRSSQTLALAATAQGGRGQGWPCRRNVSSTGSPISSRSLENTGIGITGCLR